jgi:RNA-directed DNA polymerase
MSTASPMYGWNDIRWREIERTVSKLQKRIYQASSRGDVRTVRMLQKLLMKSRSAKLIAVRRVTQDNQGKRTAGIDGVKSLRKPERLALVDTLRIDNKAKPVRRVWIPKASSDELRPLGIPTMRDRALQALVKAALEPEWEARFEANSYGFRPGRGCHDAIEAIHQAVYRKPKWVLDADIAKCYDRINHQALLEKVNTSPTVRRQLKAWLKAGVMDDGKLFPTEEGVPQGGTISPLLANIALHGLETFIVKKFPRNDKRRAPLVVRYADDLVVFHADLQVIEECQLSISEWLRGMGLELKPSKTRITHTLTVADGKPGFDFLGFHIRQFLVGKTKTGMNGHGGPLGFKTIIKPSKAAIQRHVRKLRATVRTYRHMDQRRLIRGLNPVIMGWTGYYRSVSSKKCFGGLSYVLFRMLWSWGKWRHPKKSKRWIKDKYWRLNEHRAFRPRNHALKLHQHHETAIRRHVKVQNIRSPYDGDWVYWSTRMGRSPEVSRKVASLLKRQRGRCPECQLFFQYGDALEVGHIVPRALGGAVAYYNQQLLHCHCHDSKSAREAGLTRPV